MAKKIKTIIKLQVKGGEANPAPPVGPVLSQQGLNIMDFCKAFNAKTSKQKGIPLPVWITVYTDKTFDFEVKMPPASFLIKQALKLKSGSAVPNSTKVGRLTLVQLEEIAKTKMKDLNANDIEAAKKIIAGTARSMGVETESK